MENTMNRTARLSLFAACLILTVAAVAPLCAEPIEVSTAGNDTCCFSNPRFSGVCEVTTGPDETCSDVLSYLNNQESVGKTYCGNTTIRGGWAQVECDGEASMCVPADPTRTVPAN
jgi:hypothetical protein